MKCWKIRRIEEIIYKTYKSFIFCRKEGYFMAVEFVKDVK